MLDDENPHKPEVPAKVSQTKPQTWESLPKIGKAKPQLSLPHVDAELSPEEMPSRVSLNCQVQNQELNKWSHYATKLVMKQKVTDIGSFVYMHFKTHFFRVTHILEKCLLNEGIND